MLPHGLILGQSWDDAFLKEDEVDAGPSVKRRKVETDARVSFFFFLKFADMKEKDLGWTFAALVEARLVAPSNCEVLPNTHSN